MSITITANDVHDAANKLDLRHAPCDIRISWRRSDEMSDYGRIPMPGCIVDATSIPGEEVKRSFKTYGDAVRYIAAMLKKHDVRVKEFRAEEEKKRRNRARLEKSQQRHMQKQQERY